MEMIKDLSVEELKKLIEECACKAANIAANSVSDEIIKRGVEKAVNSILITYGFDITDPSKMQRDMAFLRDLRKNSSNLKTKSFYIFLSVTIPALLYLLWLGIKNEIFKS